MTKSTKHPGLRFRLLALSCWFSILPAPAFAWHPSAEAAAANPAATNTTNAPLAITVGPYLQAPSTNSVTIVWLTNLKCVSKVEYGLAPDGPVQTAVSSHHGLIDANVTLHSVTLTGLRPGTRYFYRAISTAIASFQPYAVTFGGTVKSGDCQFTTLDDAKSRFSAVILNDRHEKTGPLEQALKGLKWTGLDLVFYNGDMLNHAENETQVLNGIVVPSCRVFAAQTPFLLARGNHDARGSFARSLLDYFPTLSNRYYFAFSHGGVRWIILDSGEDKADNAKEYSGLVDFTPYLEEETKWLKEEVQTAAFKQARFRVVLSHMPPMNQLKEPFVRSKFLYDRWVPLFNEGPIDLLLCGHTHRYAVIQPTPNQHYPMLINGIDTTIRIDVSPDQLRVATINNDGTEKSVLPPILKK